MKLFTILLLSIYSMAFSTTAFSAAEKESLVVSEKMVPDKYEGIEITVNINTGTLEELSTLLTGIGEKKAQLIIDYREQNGLFTSIEDLSKVKGIGRSIVEKNRSRILL